MPDWVTISSLGTAGGTLVLAGSTFSAVRSANRSARIAEQGLQEQRRPLLVNARLDDPLQKVMFASGHWLHAEGSEAVIDEEGGTLYLAFPQSGRPRCLGPPLRRGRLGRRCLRRT